jgi:DNA-binding NtrC family response regulator
MVGSSAVMRRLYGRIDRLARSSIPVLILGETGSGKEKVARAIERIASAGKPFVMLNCAAIPPTLFESELFGHEAGAFTGATRRHPGILAQANGGTLFLDEIGELPLAAQAKLLRAIETGEYRPVGAERLARSRFRVLAATNRDVDELVARNRFRRDLLHRLGAARIVLPRLRERVEDIPALAAEFLRGYRDSNAGAGPMCFSERAMALLESSAWPGNLRELRHVVEAAAALAVGPTIRAAHVHEVLFPVRTRGAPLTLDQIVGRAEQEAITDALRRARGHRARAAEILGISEASLYRRLARSRSLGPEEPSVGD